MRGLYIIYVLILESHLLMPTPNPHFLFSHPAWAGPGWGDWCHSPRAPSRPCLWSQPDGPLSPQIHSLCYNDCTFSVSTSTRTFEYNFLALEKTVSLAGGPSFTSKGLKYFHHFTLSLCGNQVSCIGTDSVRMERGHQRIRGQRTQEVQIVADGADSEIFKWLLFFLRTFSSKIKSFGL